MWKGSGLMMHLSKHEKKLAEDSNVIYHYTSADIFLEYIFPDRTLKLSPLEGTNDPNEFEPWVISGINSSDYHLYKEVLDKTNEFKKDAHLFPLAQTAKQENLDFQIHKCGHTTDNGIVVFA